MYLNRARLGMQWNLFKLSRFVDRAQYAHFVRKMQEPDAKKCRYSPIKCAIRRLNAGRFDSALERVEPVLG
jgi:hypothetical protein